MQPVHTLTSPLTTGATGRAAGGAHRSSGSGSPPAPSSPVRAPLVDQVSLGGSTPTHDGAATPPLNPSHLALSSAYVGVFAAAAMVPGAPAFGLCHLPREVDSTVRRIERQAPHYSNDGTCFRNREGRLPSAGRPDYYSEWTVETPGLPHRGARRIVQGAQGEMYYTHDHYRSFVVMHDVGAASR